MYTFAAFDLRVSLLISRRRRDFITIRIVFSLSAAYQPMLFFFFYYDLSIRGESLFASLHIFLFFAFIQFLCKLKTFPIDGAVINFDFTVFPTLQSHDSFI